MRLFFFFCMLMCWIGVVDVYGQAFHPAQCIGKWTGEMQIFKGGKVIQTVPVELRVTEESETSWGWRTVYGAEQQVVKDYVFRTNESATHELLLDEGNGILLSVTVAGSKSYMIFGVGNTLLTSTYTLNNNVLEFEVTSSAKGTSQDEVVYYPVQVVQRVVFKRPVE